MGKLTIKSKERRKWIKRMRVFLGLCRGCGEDSPVTMLCDKCRTQQVERAKKVKRLNREKDLCICGQPKLKRSEQCQRCYQTKRKYNGNYYYSSKDLPVENFVEKVDVFFLYNRDGGKCQICISQLKMETRFPDLMTPTIDHIIPLSKNGEHSKKNTQLCCFLCNSKKGTKVLSNENQGRLVG
ncbi:MAG: hypothetical protein HN597_14725 [Desulfobacula sp.]|jgi:5-methylcytosine-specific restriction endonuclease McrA|uniref:HNH endonuclease n=1 Tax=Desulfobacula sp. TaxID=2593537 RepID=UPI0039B89AC8|nr:hypothetical protein [Desulfobacula sp.]